MFVQKEQIITRLIQFNPVPIGFRQSSTEKKQLDYKITDYKSAKAQAENKKKCGDSFGKLEWILGKREYVRAFHEIKVSTCILTLVRLGEAASRRVNKEFVEDLIDAMVETNALKMVVKLIWPLERLFLADKRYALLKISQSDRRASRQIPNRKKKFHSFSLVVQQLQTNLESRFLRSAFASIRRLATERSQLAATRYLLFKCLKKLRVHKALRKKLKSFIRPFQRALLGALKAEWRLWRVRSGCERLRGVVEEGMLRRGLEGVKAGRGHRGLGNVYRTINSGRDADYLSSQAKPTTSTASNKHPRSVPRHLQI